MKFIVDLTVGEGFEPMEVADALLDLLTDQDDEAPYISCDGVDPLEEEHVVFEGWWHPYTKSGQVHDHPERPGRGWSVASHRLCVRVYTHRTA